MIFMQHIEVLKELGDNLYIVRTNAEALGLTSVVSLIDERYRIPLAHAMVESEIPASIETPEKYGRYVDFVKVAVTLLHGIQNMESNPDIRRRLFKGYRKVEGYVPNAEFEGFREHVEPAILRELSE